MIRRLLSGVAAIVVPVASFGVLVDRGSRRLLQAPRTAPGEEALGPALDALGGEVVRFRSRDGLRLAGRWLPAEPARHDAEGVAEGEAWAPDPREAILLLHGYTGSVAPDLVEYAPFLRRTAGVFGIDFRGHGASDDGPTTFGLREVEDIAGALAWLGERGIARVAMFGVSMGGISAIAAAVVLGDGALTAADHELFAPAAPASAPRPRIVGIVGDSVAPELRIVVESRITGPVRRVVAGRLLAGAARRLGADPRATEPIRIVRLIEGLPLMLIHGEADRTVPIADGRRLAAAAGSGIEHWTVPDADHCLGHATAAAAYEARVTGFMRRALAGAREAAPIIAPPPRLTAEAPEA